MLVYDGFSRNLELELRLGTGDFAFSALENDIKICSRLSNTSTADIITFKMADESIIAGFIDPQNLLRSSLDVDMHPPRMFDATEASQLDIDLHEMFPTCADSGLLSLSPESLSSVAPTTPTFTDLINWPSPQPQSNDDLSHLTASDLSLNDICDLYDSADWVYLDARPSGTESYCDTEEDGPQKLSDELEELKENCVPNGSKCADGASNEIEGMKVHTYYADEGLALMEVKCMRSAKRNPSVVRTHRRKRTALMKIELEQVPQDALICYGSRDITSVTKTSAPGFHFGLSEPLPSERRGEPRRSRCSDTRSRYTGHPLDEYRKYLRKHPKKNK